MARNRLANMLFDDDYDDEFQLLAIAVIEEEEEMANEGQTSGRRGSIPGHDVIQRDRVAGAFRMLAYGVPADSIDEYVRIGESTVIESLKKFVKAIIAVLEDEYLRSPNNDDITRLLEFNSCRGFLEMLGSIDSDSIYPSWSTLVKTIPSPKGNKNKHFAASQESAMKDVERAFGVLQSHFVIVRGLVRFWDQETLGDIMKACIIMHNIIVKDEREIG
ncbi:hypothetical protein Dsin_027236 [Dipteronia sinensis]|uniref:DDE Tnp4 domain-containing protein n=1 Tax=Dipteronia sinensis TaxID=43782 RepID=A0AAE0DT95_9ROSI|nr:hypothetical protein Dsin_027236 [Dipteronia sinensis]